MNRTLAVSTILALVAVAGTTLVVTARPQWWTDAQAIRVRAPGAPVREILWQPASPLPTSGSPADPAPRDEYEPRVSADGTLMVLVRGRAGANADLFTSRWSPKGWSTPEPIAAVNTDKDELGPELSADGRRLYFYSDRPGGLGGYDLWVSTLTDNTWGVPVNLGPSVNTAWNEYGPALTPAGDTLYFASNRPRPDEPPTTPETWAATVRERRNRHDYDLYAAKLAPDATTPTEAATPLVGLNTDADESSPAVSPAGDFLYFASDRAGGLGGYDLYRARLAPDRALARPENLGDAVNSPSNDLDPALASAGFRLTFSSDRPHPPTTAETAPSSAPDSALSPQPSPPPPPRYTLWTTDSREVFRDVGPLTMPTLGSFWPKILMLLAALLPLLLLSRFLLGNASWRSRLGRMNLLAQCVVLSLILHAVLASLLAVWKVGSGILDAVRSGGGTGTRVILSSAPASGSAGSITTQIRGALTDGVMAIPELSTPAPSAPLAAPAERDPATSEAPWPRLAPAPTTPAPIDLPSRRSPEAPSPTASAPTPAPSAPAPTSLPSTQAPAPAMPEAPDASPTLAANTSAPAPTAAPQARAELGRVSAFLPALADAPTGPALAAEGPTPRRDTGPSRTGPTAAPAPAAPGAAPAASLPSAPTADAPTAEVAPNTAPALGASLGAPAPTTPMGRAPEASRAPLPALTAPADPGAPLAAPSTGASRNETPAASPPLAAPTPVATGGSPGAAPAVPASIAPAASSASAEEPATPSAALGSLPSTGPASPVPGLPAGAPTPAPGPSNLPAITAPAGAPGAALEPEPRRSEGSTPGEAPASAPSLPTTGSGLDDATLPIPKETFNQRRPESRAELLERMGGSAETEKAVGLALEWFKRHQNPDGRWSSRHFDDACGQCSGQGEVDADVAATGLALLCYLGAGHTQTQEGPYRQTVELGLRWLLARQAPDGDLRGRETMYSQTVAAVALCEAYAMTRDAALAGPAQKAVDLVLKRTAAASPDKRDTSVLGWLVFTVESARRAGLTVPVDVFDRARTWLDGTSDPRRTGLYTYGPGKPASAPMTAEAMFVQQLLGHARGEPRMDASARFVAQEPPTWDRSAPTHHWYYATLALFQHQGPAWESWNTALKRELLGRQHAAGPNAGSWDPQDEWSRVVGRVYQTAVCTLSLEVYYRYRTAPTTAPATPPADAPKQAPGRGAP